MRINEISLIPVNTSSPSWTLKVKEKKDFSLSSQQVPFFVVIKYAKCGSSPNPF